MILHKIIRSCFSRHLTEKHQLKYSSSYELRETVFKTQRKNKKNRRILVCRNRTRKQILFNHLKKGKRKKSFFGLIAIAFISLSSFTSVDSNDVLAHSCTYRMYNAAGQYLGTQTISLPDVVDCGSILGQYAAIETWNDNH